LAMFSQSTTVRKLPQPTTSRRKTWLRPDVGSGKFRVLIV
jgi:hypothetical protein